MRILVYGGTRGVGRLFVERAAGAGHAVTVFARDPSAIASGGPGAPTVVRGDAKDRSAVKAAIPSHDAVVVSLGPNGLERLQRFVGPATAWIVEAMEAAGVRRLLLMSAVGVGPSRKEAPAIMRWFVAPVVLGPTFRDRAVAEEAVRGSRLDWTIVRPLWLTNGAPTGRWKATTNGREVRNGIDRADVAAFLLHELEAPEFVRKAVALEGP